MGEIRTVTTLKAKREEIIHAIRLYENQFKQARANLAHISAAIKIFEASGDLQTMPKYVDTYRLYKRGEQMTLCKEALASGAKTTRELSLHVMAAKGFDVGDKVLAKSVASQLIHSLRMQADRGKLIRGGKVGTALVWALP